jgi:hypothetical protein
MLFSPCICTLALLSLPKTPGRGGIPLIIEHYPCTTSKRNDGKEERHNQRKERAPLSNKEKGETDRQSLHEGFQSEEKKKKRSRGGRNPCSDI